jgi:hypothetical protein
MQQAQPAGASYNSVWMRNYTPQFFPLAGNSDIGDTVVEIGFERKFPNILVA